jgi:hypothetical protein
MVKLGVSMRFLLLVICVLVVLLSHSSSFVNAAMEDDMIVEDGDVADSVDGTSTSTSPPEPTPASANSPINGETESITEEAARKFTIKKLKSLLAERGLSCKGCAEKEDFVRLFVENQHSTLVQKQAPPTPPPEPHMDDEKMEEVSLWQIV